MVTQIQFNVILTTSKLFGNNICKCAYESYVPLTHELFITMLWQRYNNRNLWENIIVCLTIDINLYKKDIYLYAYDKDDTSIEMKWGFRKYFSHCRKRFGFPKMIRKKFNAMQDNIAKYIYSEHPSRVYKYCIGNSCYSMKNHLSFFLTLKELKVTKEAKAVND